MARPPCTIEGCNKPNFGRGMCHMHYMRVKRHGSTNAGRTSPGALIRFVNEVAVPFASDECLAWPYARNIHGYGQMWVGGKKVLASRYVCAAVNGPPPSSIHEAAHLCGKGHLGCVNPRHLVWKTPEENRMDKIVHGTIPRGERSPHAKLSSEQVKNIRTAHRSFKRSLTERFGVTRSTIDDVLSRKKWSHL